MGRLLAIDYGRKRCGVAVTDILKIAANGLPTLRTCDLENFLRDYCSKEQVDEIIIGRPTTMHGTPSESMEYIEPFMRRLRKLLPEMKISMYDERFTSAIAHREMIAAGVPRSKRQQKELADKTAAVIILTDYLMSRELTSLI